MASVNILLIEDNPEDAVWATIILKKNKNLKFDVHVCEYCSKGLELVKTGKFAVVILDLCLPDSKGLETLKSFVKNSKVPVIVFTGINDEFIKEESLKIGISGFLVKGKTNGDELKDCIMKCISAEK